MKKGSLCCQGRPMTDTAADLLQILATARARRVRRELGQKNTAVGTANTSDGASTPENLSDKENRDAIPVYQKG